MIFPLYDLNPHRRFPWITVLIIVANVVVMGAQGLQPSVDVVYQYGFVPRRVSELESGQPVVVAMPPVQELRGRNRLVVRPAQPMVLSTEAGDVYLTFLTTMFLHGGWGHLFMNMWMLWIFGNNVEDRLGRFLFLCYYLVGGLVGTVAQWAVDPQSTIPMIGASGAVATALGGYAITYPSAKIRTLVFFLWLWILDLPALLVLGFWLLSQMFAVVFVLGNVAGAAGPQVAFWAHIGGFVAGVVLMPLLALGASPPDADWRREAQEMFRFDEPRSRG